MPLRQRQIEALEASNARWNEGIHRQLIQLPTGGGKTVVAANMPTHHEIDGRILFMVHREELVEQTVRAFRKWNPTWRVGVEMASSYSDPLDRVVVASVPTIGREGSKRIDRICGTSDIPFHLVQCDEAHHAVATTYKNVFRRLGLLPESGGQSQGRLGDGAQPNGNGRRFPLLVGITATPNRGDGKAMAEVFDEIVYQYSMRQAIEEGWLAELRGFKVKTATGLDGVRRTAGDFNLSDLANAVNTPQRNAMVAKAWIENAWPRQTIGFTVDVQHAKDLAGTFQRNSIPTEAIWADDALRADKLARHKRGDLKVLFNCGILTEGYDDWRVECLDTETEVLTPSGWKRYTDEVRLVTSLNTSTGRLETVPAQAKVVKEHSGVMINFRSGQYDLRVTDHHRMLIGTGRRTSSMNFLLASDLNNYERFRLPVSAEQGVCHRVDLSDDELRFIAWFITDGGWHNKGRAVCIAQSKSEECIRRIETLLQRLGYNYRKYTAPNRGFASVKPLTRFVIPKGVRGGKRGWVKLLRFLDKNLHLDFIGLPSRQFAVFWEELLWGDGNGDTRPTRLEQLNVCNDTLLSRLQAAASMAGFATNATINQELPSGKTSWLMSISNRRFLEVKPNDRRRSLPSVWKEGVTKETVWCVQNKNSTLIVRRHGSVAIVGNCIIMARPTSSQLLFVQMIGRGSRLPEGIDNLIDARKVGLTIAKNDCIVLDVVDCTRKNSLVTLSSIFGMNAEMDLKGKSVVKTVKRIEEMAEENPNVDFSKVVNVNDLDTIVEKVDLFAYKAPEEMRSASLMSWHKALDGSYVLHLLNHEKIVITEDLLGRHTVQGVIQGMKFFEHGFDELQRAVQFAEMKLSTYGKQYMDAMKRHAKGWGDFIGGVKPKATVNEQKWQEEMNAPASNAHINLLRRYYGNTPLPTNLTTGQAKDLISQYISRTVRA